MAEAAALVRSFPVGRYTATLTVPRAPANGAAICASMEWAPELPSRLTPAELAQYRQGRDAALREVARVLGLNVGVLDL